MNATQKAKARSILEQDCEITGIYINSEGKTCAIGALLLLAGSTPRSLKNMGTSTINQCSVVHVNRLKKTYGLTLDQLGLIQRANDGCYLNVPSNEWTNDLRRADVLRVLDAMEVDDEAVTG